MSLSDANLFPEAAAIIHNNKLSNQELATRKGLYLEGLIRFLDIYSQTEIGDGIEIDIIKVALFVNSNRFVNDDLHNISSLEDVFFICEELALSGLPLWRFLKLSEYQSMILEKEYESRLVKARELMCEHSICGGCIWYEELDTPFGLLKRCQKPRQLEDPWKDNKASFDPSKKKSCKWRTT